MRHIKVGIAYEGGDDGMLIAAIVRKITEPLGYTFEHFEPETPSTAILDYITSYTNKFVSAGVDMGIYCTDQDEETDSRRRIIYEKIEKTDAAFILKAAIGVPVPHIEAWLIQQDSIVKNLLGIDGSLPLPHPELSPKDRLTALYSESDVYTRTRNELRIDIAERLNIDHCSKNNAEFKLFVQDIRSIISRLK